MRKQIIVCRELVRDASTGQLRTGGIVGIFPDGRIEHYESTADAADVLSIELCEAVPHVPEEEGWEGAQDLTAPMRTKFLKLYNEERSKLSRKR
jgi:hypothetical protein